MSRQQTFEVTLDVEVEDDTELFTSQEITRILRDSLIGDYGIEVQINVKEKEKEA